MNKKAIIGILGGVAVLVAIVLFFIFNSSPRDALFGTWIEYEDDMLIEFHSDGKFTLYEYDDEGLYTNKCYGCSGEWNLSDDGVLRIENYDTENTTVGQIDIQNNECWVYYDDFTVYLERLPRYEFDNMTNW